jgi:hypothetical protein
MSDRNQQAIQKAAEHWGQEMGWTAEETLEFLAQRQGQIVVEPENKSFAARGQAAKVERGLTALKQAMNGNPSRQWETAWGGENE